jgi:hypothetical protein
MMVIFLVLFVSVASKWGQSRQNGGGRIGEGLHRNIVEALVPEALGHMLLPG